VTLSGARIVFWSDHPAGATEGVAPPVSWHLEYLKKGAWAPVPNASGYPTSPMRTFLDVSFPKIKTQCLRAVFDASGTEAHYAAVAVEEWEALAPKAELPSKRGSPPPNATVCPAQ
jgi:hypothetical protein